MSIANFKPELWSPLLVQTLAERRDLSVLFNRDYEGEIKAKGNTVHINQSNGVTVKDYVRSDGITSDDYASNQRDLVINNDKYAAVSVDDADRIQANLSLDSPILQDFADAITEKRNEGLLQSIATDASLLTENVIDAGAAIDYDDFVEADRLMNWLKIPADGRFFFFEPNSKSDLLKDANFIEANKYGSNVPLITGEIGMLCNFRMVMTPSIYNDNATATPKYHNIFCHWKSVAVAKQKHFNVEALRDKDDFDDHIRTRVLWGDKVIQPKGVVICKRNAA